MGREEVKPLLGFCCIVGELSVCCTAGKLGGCCTAGEQTGVCGGLPLAAAWSEPFAADAGVVCGAAVLLLVL